MQHMDASIKKLALGSHVVHPTHPTIPATSTTEPQHASRIQRVTSLSEEEPPLKMTKKMKSQSVDQEEREEKCISF